MSGLEHPHFRQPFTRPAGQRVNVVEQGTIDHIASCQFTIAACPAGFRDERPEFGWSFPAFATLPIDASQLVAALQQFEPRAPDVTIAEAQDVAAAVQTVNVTTRVVSDGDDS